MKKQYFYPQTCRMHQDFFSTHFENFFEVEKIDKIAFFGFWVENLHQFSIEYQQFLLF